VFTLNNSRGTEPIKFPLRDDRKFRAIVCSAALGPTFGESDIRVSEYSAKWFFKGSLNDADHFGETSLNSTGFDGPTFLAGDRRFCVRDIEVFQIS
jgi:hypothetical protein